MSPRRGQILPFTLTELFALLFFALALALTYQWSERFRMERTIDGHEELLEVAAALGPDGSQALARALQSGQKSVPDDFQELVRRLSSEENVREILEAELREAGLDSMYVDTVSTQALVDSLVAKRESAERQAEALAAAAELSDSSRNVLEGLADAFAQSRSDLERTEEEKRDLQNQLRYWQRRVGNGLDHPPCWADANGRPEYAFEVTLHDNAVTVKPIWPEHREDDARNVNGMIQAPGTQLSRAEFSRRATPILLWSQQHNPECRHFVVLVDSVTGGKEAFKDGMRTTEHFFYKYMAN